MWWWDNMNNGKVDDKCRGDIDSVLANDTNMIES